MPDGASMLMAYARIAAIVDDLRIPDCADVLETVQQRIHNELCDQAPKRRCHICSRYNCPCRKTIQQPIAQCDEALDLRCC